MRTPLIVGSGRSTTILALAAALALGATLHRPALVANRLGTPGAPMAQGAGAEARRVPIPARTVPYSGAIDLAAVTQAVTTSAASDVLARGALLARGGERRRFRRVRQSGAPHTGAAGAAVRVYLTTSDLRKRLAREPDLSFRPSDALHVLPRRTIRVDDRTAYQRMDGFGAAFTDSSAWLLHDGLGTDARAVAMRRLFSLNDGIGLSLMRVPIAASDFTRDGRPYSYDDVPRDQLDLALAHFSVRRDEAYIIPIIRQALRLNPSLKTMAGAWSPPAWMKTNKALDNIGYAGRLLPDPVVRAALARYIVLFLQAYAARGIPIFAVTPNNEPLQATDHPGLTLPAGDEIDLIAHYLGPSLVRARLRTKILAFDYDWTTDYPLQVLRDKGASPYVAGTAWHCYIGHPTLMTSVHDAFPHRDAYETECSGGIAPGPAAELIILSARNWAQGALLWNLALDTRGGPKAGDGCLGCYALLTVNPAKHTVAYNRDYYELGQASRFVHPGTRRVASNTFVTYRGVFLRQHPGYTSPGVDDVAFKNPDGSLALMAYNNALSAQTFAVAWHGRSFRYTLPAGATVTFTWAGPGSSPRARSRAASAPGR